MSGEGGDRERESERRPAGRPRRPPPTIDLTAKELHDVPRAPQTPAPDDQSVPSSAAPPPVEEARPHDAPESRPDRDRDGADGNGPRRGPLFQSPLNLFSAGALGAVAATALIAALWGAGVFRPSEGERTAAQFSLIERQLRDIAQRPPVGPAADTSRIVQRLDQLEQRQDSLKTMEQRLARVEADVASPRSAADPALPERLKAVESAVTDLARQLPELRQRGDEAFARAREAQARADASGGTAPANVDPALTGSVEALHQRIAALEQSARELNERLARETSRAANDRTGRSAVAVFALRTAVERGEPYATELTAAKPFVGDGPAWTALARHAETGVPSLAALQRDFVKAEDAILKTVDPKKTESGIVDKLQAKAERLVRIRTTDAGPGDDAGSVVARIAARLGQGELRAALDETAKLPDGARRLADEALAAARSRLAAIEAARRLSAESLSALGKAAP